MYCKIFIIGRFLSGLFLSFSALLLNIAYAAQLELIQGDRLSGKVVSFDASGVVLESPILGQLSVPFDQIQAVNGAPKLATQLIAYKKATVDSQVQSEKRSNPAQSEILGEAEAKVKYSGRLDVGGNFTRGNSDKDAFAVTGELQAKRDASRTTYGLELNEASANDETSTANRSISAQHDMFLNDRDYAYTSLQFEQDKLEGLELRSSLGGGLGRDFWNTDKKSLSGEVGLLYVQENYELAPDEAFPSLKLALKYKRKLWSDKVELFNNTSTSTNLEDTSDTLFKNRFGLRIPISEQISFSTQFKIDYDNKPAPGSEKTDTTLIFGLGYGF